MALPAEDDVLQSVNNISYIKNVFKVQFYSTHKKLKEH